MRRSQRRTDPGRLRLWKIGCVLLASFVITLATLAALAWAALALLHYPRLPHQKTIAVHDATSVATLVFASVAGAGALVALVMAYRRQRVAEANSAHDRTRVLNERFTATAAQLGHYQAAVRLAGVHAMAGLADDWEENRQTCIDVLCAYLRIPYEPDPGEGASAAERLAFRASREVRHSVIRVIAAHLTGDAALSWQGLNFDFAGVVFDGGSFSDAKFSGGGVNFYGAEFSGGTVSFHRAVISSGTVSFEDAKFSSGLVGFSDAKFSGGTVNFSGAEFSGSDVGFSDAKFSGGGVLFSSAEFSGSNVGFTGAKFTGGTVGFSDAVFSGGGVLFSSAEFSGGNVGFTGAKFTGGTVSFSGAEFSGSAVDFSGAADWSHPPKFDWEGTPPLGINLPTVGPDGLVIPPSAAPSGPTSS